MRVGLHLGAELGRALLRGPHPRVGEEEALLRGEPVDRARGLPRQRLLQCVVSDGDPAEVRSVLAEREAPVQVQRVEHRVRAELIRHPVRALLVARRVIGCPPVLEVALGVELSAAVVEAVRHLVADDRPDAAVIHGVIPGRIEERRLQDPGREIDAVEGRTVEGVHRGRRHEPFPAVHRLADFARVALRLPLRACVMIGDEPGAGDRDAGVVSPGVGVADLLLECMELLQGPRPRGVAHPLERLDAVAERRLEIAHHRQRALSGRRRELLPHVRLPEQVAEVAVRPAQAALPARQNGLRSRQHRLEAEVLLGERAAQHRRSVPRHAPAQLALPGLERHAADQAVQGADEIGLRDVDRVERGEPPRGKVGAPVEAGAHSLERVHRHLVVGRLRIAPLHVGHRGLRQRSLERENGLSRCARALRVVAQQSEGLHDVVHVAAARRNSS